MPAGNHLRAETGQGRRVDGVRRTKLNDHRACAVLLQEDAQSSSSSEMSRDESSLRNAAAAVCKL
jgi:hypothetical protein